MSNAILTDKELDKVYKLYENYGAEHLGDFIRMVWKEAHSLGVKDGYIEGFNYAKSTGGR
jgi:hypothetical protein